MPSRFLLSVLLSFCYGKYVNDAATPAYCKERIFCSKVELSLHLSMRIDKWLWAVRLFKTRSLASEACKSGKEKIDGRSVKPACSLKGAGGMAVQGGRDTEGVRGSDLLERRVNAGTGRQYYEGITPVRGAPGMPAAFHAAVFERNRGAGRPTKKERREVDQL